MVGVGGDEGQRGDGGRWRVRWIGEGCGCGWAGVTDGKYQWIYFPFQFMALRPQAKHGNADVILISFIHISTMRR
jgi:hypothetical protein